MASATGICYQNADKTVILIDIPTSIIYAQGSDKYTSENILSSRPPPTVPFPITNEPPKEEATCQTNNHDVRYHQEIRELIRDAIEEIKSSSISQWCLPRRWVSQTKYHITSKRKRGGDEGATIKESSGGDQTNMSTSQRDFCFARNSKIYRGTWRDMSANKSDPYIITQAPICFDDIYQIHNRVFQNPLQELIPLSVSHSNSHCSLTTFHIPAQSTFLLGSIPDSVFTFKSAALQLLPPSPNPSTTATFRGQFDFILLDPPWPNASAKRARSYHQSPPRSLRDTCDLLTSIQLEDHMGPEGYVGIWITNKPQIREVIVSDLFKQQWHVDLIEEWIWIKTTVVGEPITDLDSAWRNPYEVMLLGRRRERIDVAAAGAGEQQKKKSSGSSSSAVKRRIIAGVPDLHSRKPSLKGLVESVLFVDGGGQYRALEIFARSLTAGWWAWGDEVLKFNWEGAWMKRREYG